MAETQTLKFAQEYLAAGLSILKVRADGSKAPAGEWKLYQQQPPSRETVAAWFGNGASYGIGIIGGKVSGGVEVIDYDTEELLQDYRESVESEAPGLIERLVRIRTPRPGRHFYYRCETVEGNQKLAQRKVPAEKGDDGAFEEDGQYWKVITLIETRGEGGMVIAPGSPPECHPLKQTYQLLQGSLTQIQKITSAERKILLRHARALNEHVPEIAQQKKAEQQQDELRPGDDFNQRGDARELLRKHGWKYLIKGKAGEQWSRPGVNHCSATLFDGRVLYVFSTNAHPFDNNKSYPPFSIYTLLEHKGDFKEATKTLAKEGYGEPWINNGSTKADGTTIETRSAPDDWPDPRPLPDGLRPVPLLPEALIQEPLRPWLVDIAERLQVPLEFPTVSAIVLLAAVIGNQIRIRPKRRDDWRVTPNLWGAIIGRPGVMKSPAIAEPMKAVYRLVKEAEAEHEKALRDWRFSKEASEAKKAARRDKLKKAAKAGKDMEEFRAEIEGGEEEEPTERRYIINDTTVEKYGELLNQNPNGLLIFRDELTGWLRSLDDERRANDRAFFLEAWNGDGSYTYDRIGRGTLKISHTTTSILGGIQPGPLESYLRNALGYGEGDDGLMQRFQMIVYPDITGEWRNVDRWPDTEAKNRAFTIYKHLSELDPQTIGAETDDDGRGFVGFGGEAQELFSEWLTDLNHSLRSGEFEHPALEAHFSKYKSLMPTLALIFHLCDVASGNFAGAVSLRAAEMAAAWCEYLMEHAKRIYGLGIGAAAIHARTLAGHLRNGDLSDPFKARDVWHKGWAGLSKSSDVIEPLDLLESLGWLRSVEIRPGGQGGRPTVEYFINPKTGDARL